MDAQLREQCYTISNHDPESSVRKILHKSILLSSSRFPTSLSPLLVTPPPPNSSSPIDPINGIVALFLIRDGLREDLAEHADASRIFEHDDQLGTPTTTK